MPDTPQDRSAPDDVIAAALGRTAGGPGPACLDTEELAAYYDRSLDADELARFETHVAGCRACQSRLVAIARSEPVPVQRAGWRTAWMGSPWRLAWVAPVLVAGLAAVVWYAQRPAILTESTTTLASRGLKDEKAQVATEAQMATAEEKLSPAQATGAGSTARRAEAAPKAAAPADAGRLAQGQVGAGAAAPPSPSALPAEADRPLADVAAGNEKLSSKEAAAERRANTFAAGAEGLRAGSRVVAVPARTTSWRFDTTGAISRSDDGGVTWRLQAMTNVELLAGSAVSSTVCWAAGRGGAVWRTIDGERWAPTASPAGVAIAQIDATDALHATVTAVDGRVFETSDGGQTWRER